MSQTPTTPAPQATGDAPIPGREGEVGGDRQGRPTDGSALQGAIAETAATWAVMFPISSWSLPVGGDPWKLGRIWGGQIASRVMEEVVQPELDRLNTEIDRLTEDLFDERRHSDATCEAVAERDQLRATVERVRDDHDRTCNLRQAVRQHPKGSLDGVTCEMCGLLGLMPALGQPAKEGQ